MFTLVIVIYCGVSIFGALCGRELMKCSEFPKAKKKGVFISEKEKYLLKDYALSYMIYRELTNSFIRSTTPVLNRKLIINKLKKVKRKVPAIFDNCVVTRSRTVDFSPIRSNLDSIDEDKRIHLIHDGFSLFIETLIESYGTTTSMEVSRQIFESVFNSTIEGYRDIFYRCGIPFQMPPGILDREKARFVAFFLFKDILEGLIKECQWEMIARIHDSPNVLKRKVSKTIVTKYLSTDGTIEIEKINDLLFSGNQENVKPLKILDQTTNAFFDILNAWFPDISKHLGEEKAKSVLENPFMQLSPKTKSNLTEIGIINRLPEGVLEDEKISIMSKEELEFQVKERTMKLKKALVKVKKTKSKLQHAYRELKKLDKMKSDFIDIASHELRTPLTPIKSLIQLIEEGALNDMNASQKEHVFDILNTSIDRLTGTISEMLDITRLEKVDLKLEQLSMADIVEKTIKKVQFKIDEKKIKVRAEIPADLPRFSGDRVLISLLILNLLSNARRFTPSGGEITVRCEREVDRIHTTVTDTGIGIPEDDLERIFNPFYQVEEVSHRKYGGVGLGLNIVKGIIKRHKGDIRVESELGKGSTFHFLLPLKQRTNKKRR